MRRRLLRAVATILFASLAGTARAEVSEVRISHGYGVLYLPLMIMASEKLVEKQARSTSPRSASRAFSRFGPRRRTTRRWRFAGSPA